MPIGVQLQRFDIGTPWGFRLQGGRDFRGVLSVKKVTPGSPADGPLGPGDAILAIGGYDSTQMTHTQASDMIKHSGTFLQLTIEKNTLLPPPSSAKRIARGKFEPVKTSYLR